MGKVKYIIKDPSFKFFLVGFVSFLIITAGGIAIVRKVMEDRKTAQATQTEQTAIKDENKKQDQKPTTNNKKTDDHKPETNKTETNNQISNGSVADTDSKTESTNGSRTPAPTEIAKTGNDQILVKAISLATVVYLLTFVVKSIKK